MKKAWRACLFLYAGLFAVQFAPGAWKLPCPKTRKVNHTDTYCGTLQEKAGEGDNPVLIRIETKSGHSASSSTKALETTADIYSFILYNLGVTPKY